MTELHRIILAAVLTCQFISILGVSYVPELRNNRLSENEDRNLPGRAVALSCGGVCVTEGTIKSKERLSTVLTSAKFGLFPMTAGPVVAQGARPIIGNIGTFSFIKIKGTRHTQYVLQVDYSLSGTDAYWLPQGGTIDIPSSPGIHDPKYVFTPDFSGCSWTITPLSNGYLRLRHVEGGKEHEQFNALSEAEKGGDRTMAMEYKEYGYVMTSSHMISNVPAFAYMKYQSGGDGRWLLKFQRKTCSDVAGGFAFNNGELAKVTLVETSSNFPQVQSTKSMIVN